MLPGDRTKTAMRELINLINDNVHACSNFVDQTLNLSRIENDTLPLSVCRQDILPRGRAHDGRLRLLCPREADRHRLTATPPGRMTVAVDTDKFSKILSNLISNALKYTPEEGHIAVSHDARRHALPEKLTAAASSHYLTVGERHRRRHRNEPRGRGAHFRTLQTADPQAGEARPAPESGSTT